MIILKSKEEIQGIKKASEIVALSLRYIEDFVRPGVKLSYLDKLIRKFIEQHGGYPAFLGYRGFPAASCISLNEEVVHGVPDRRTIKEEDIVKIDIGVKFNRFYGDGAKTFIMEGVKPEVKKLVEVTCAALSKAIQVVQPGVYLGDVSHAIESRVRDAGYSPVKALSGHGVGLALHEDPLVPNYGPPKRGIRLKSGMVLAIEPMVNMGTEEVFVKPNGWTVVTRDGLPSAHFEHTVAILDNEVSILTKLNHN